MFKDYCRSAMLWAESVPMDSATMTTFTKDGSSLSLLQMDSTSQTGEHLKRHLPDICGANLVVAVIAKVSIVGTMNKIERKFPGIKLVS